MDNDINTRLAFLENNIDKAFARMTMIEFAQEIIIANELARCPVDASQKWKDDFRRLMRQPSFPDTNSPVTTEREQKEARIFDLSTKMADRFVEKVQIRESLIRQQAEPFKSGPG